ncbi:hypothetical protein HanPSC8_Chr08g0323441 [Helianthus annuus]|nr:hypothetical protein HanPSC8_Chr08g0323441 [Helianthus annuus]
MTLSPHLLALLLVELSPPGSRQHLLQHGRQTLQHVEYFGYYPIERLLLARLS